MRPHELLKLHPDNLTPKQLAQIKAFLGACNGCNAHAHRRGATREALGPYLAIMEAIAALHLLQGKPAPDLQSNRQDEMEPPEMDAAHDMGQQDAGARDWLLAQTVPVVCRRSTRARWRGSVGGRRPGRGPGDAGCQRVSHFCGALRRARPAPCASCARSSAMASYMCSDGAHMPGRWAAVARYSNNLALVSVPCRRGQQPRLAEALGGSGCICLHIHLSPPLPSVATSIDLSVHLCL